MYLDEALRLYFADRNLRPKTERDYTSVLNCHAGDLFAVPVKDWTREQIERLILNVQDESIANANKLKRVLQAIWRWMAMEYPDEPEYRAEPFVKVGKKLKKVKPRKGRLYKDDFPFFFAQVASLPRIDAAWMTMLLYTALRHRSCALMRWEWIDWSRGVIAIPGDEMKNHDDHECVLSALPMELLRRLHARQRHPKTGLVFPDLDARCYEDIKLPSGRSAMPHNLRRTHGSIMKELGYDVDVRKRVLGHRLSDVTENYCIDSDDSLREVNERVLGAILGHVQQQVA